MSRMLSLSILVIPSLLLAACSGAPTQPDATNVTSQNSQSTSARQSGLSGRSSATAGASASTGTMSRNRPKSIARPSVVLYQSVLPVKPPNAEPLLFAADVNA